MQLGLWEVIRSQWWKSHKWDKCPYEKRHGRDDGVGRGRTRRGRCRRRRPHAAARRSRRHRGRTSAVGAGGREAAAGRSCGGSRESGPTTFPSPLDGSGGVPAAAAARGGRAGGRRFRVGAEQSLEESAPRPLQPLAEYVPTRCPPSAGRVHARAAADELGAAELPRGHLGRGRASRGAGPALPPPEGEGGIELLWAIPGEIRCSEKRASKALILICAVLFRESRGSEFLLPGLGSSLGAMVGLRGFVRGRCARLPSPEAESLLVSLVHKSVALTFLIFILGILSLERSFLFKSGRRVLLGSSSTNLAPRCREARDSFCAR